MSNEQPRQPDNFHSNEIDLFDLIESIWKEKVLIVIITAIVTSLAVAYALLATPIYQASTVFYEPSASAIQSYNLGRKEAELTEFTISDIYKVFLTNLNSQQLRNDFFENVYLPSLSTEEQQAPRSALLTGLNNSLSIRQSNPKENKNEYQISVNHKDAQKAAEWANLYLQKAVSLSKKELKTDINSEMNTRKKSIQLKVDNLLMQARAERLDEAVRLKEALSIAKAIGLENPSLPTGKSTEEGANYVDRNLAYMRGSKALESQIQILEKRQNDLAFVPDLRELTAQLNLLNAISLNNDKETEVVKIDNQALVPDTPIKPNKRLIVIVGVLLGGMLGLLVALVRTAILQRKQRTKK